jgi:hypothetical protein
MATPGACSNCRTATEPLGARPTSGRIGRRLEPPEWDAAAMMLIDIIAKWRGSCDLVELTPNVST